MRSIPAQHQRDPAKAAGQIINRNEDMMDDMADFSAQRRTVKPGVSAEEKAALLDDMWKPSRDLPHGWDHV